MRPEFESVEVIAKASIECKSITVERADTQLIRQGSLSRGMTTEQMHFSTKEPAGNTRTAITRGHAIGEKKLLGHNVLQRRSATIGLGHNRNGIRVLEELVGFVYNRWQIVQVHEISSYRQLWASRFRRLKMRTERVILPVNIEKPDSIEFAHIPQIRVASTREPSILLGDPKNRFTVTDKFRNHAGRPVASKARRNFESNRKLSPERLQVWQRGMNALPDIKFPSGCMKNGEALDTDEAAVWKRVLNYRVAQFLRPNSILETHPGFRVSTQLYRTAAKNARILTLNEPIHVPDQVDLVDIDPFGQPWDAIDQVRTRLSKRGVVMVTSGEVQAVVRRLARAQRFKTHLYGRQTPRWVTEEYLPLLENKFTAKTAFFYAFPTSVRVILSRRKLPSRLWAGCPQWMWWFNSAAKECAL